MPCYLDEEPASKRKKTNGGITIPARFLQADTSTVTRSSDCFSGKQFCVFNGIGSLSKHDLEKKIASGGGDIVQNPGKRYMQSEITYLYVANLTVRETFCVIAAKDDLKVKSLRQRRQWNVARPSWVTRCLNAGKLLPFHPEDLLVVTKATEKEIEKNYDEFGNNLFEETLIDQIPFILNRVREQVWLNMFIEGIAGEFAHMLLGEASTAHSLSDG